MPVVTSRQPFRLSPSLVAHYFFLECDRFLRFKATPKERARAEGVPVGAFDHSALMRDVMASGLAWEERVVREHLGDRAVVAEGAGALHERRFDVDATIAALKRMKPGEHLYQGTFRVPDGFYASFGLDRELVAFSDCHPDLIEVMAGPRGRVFRIIDVKRGDTVQLIHRVQVLLYALMLKAILESEGVTDATVDLDIGGVWLGEQPAPEYFTMDALRPFMRGFLGEQLPGLLAGEAGDAFWHFTYNCERCGFKEHCAEEMRRTDDVSRLTNLTTHGKRQLRGAGVRSLADLEAFLNEPASEAVLEGCASLSGDRHYLEQRLAAFRAQAATSQGSSTALPRNENVAVFLTLQREPLAGSTYLAGALVHVKAGLEAIFSPRARATFFDAAGKPKPWLVVAERPDDVSLVRDRFVRGLHAVLAEVDAFNAIRDWKDQLSLQVYTHTERDREQLTALLLDCLAEPTLAHEAMALLLHFQCPDLILADDPPDRPVPYPVIVLQNALTKMVALPIEVSYTLPEVLASLGSTFQYRRKEYFHYPLGNGLRSEPIHAVWHQGKADKLGAIAQEAGAYLYAERALLWSLRGFVGERLFAWPPKFRLPGSLGFSDTLLARLAFFTRYESVLQFLALRDERAEPHAVRVRGGLVAELRAVDAAHFEVIDGFAMPVEGGGFGNWLLSRSDEAGRRAQLEFRDYAYRDKLYMPASRHLAMVGVEEVEDENGAPRRVRLGYKTPFEGDAPAPGEVFHLQERFTDFNSDKVIGFLRDLDGAGETFFHEVLRNPDVAAGALPLADEVEAIVAAQRDALGLSRSQLAAFDLLTRQRLLAVWGPPGTGKTHFLATAVLALADAHAAAGKPFRVMITAFTHAAIENLLRKIHQLAAARPKGAAIAMGKLKSWQGATPEGAATLVEAKSAGWFAAHPVSVVGATVYAGIKAYQKGQLPGFDLVLVDEASQVRVAEAAVPASVVAPGGRLVLAGDDMQLPPIVTGAYPDAASGEPVLHRSIFEAVRSRLGPTSPVVAKLLENRRMNDVLTGFAAELLYGADYRCFDAAIAGRRLALGDESPASSFTEACLDPAQPMTVVVLEGVRATQQSPLEARLVADLVMCLRARLRAEDGSTPEDRSFFRDGVFVVSPHRAQNRAIRQELARRRNWLSAPFVDTVDKMQGQEADVAIVSYGVADPEYALMESEFIYSVNRLNVAVTRARAKSVVFLSEPLLTSLPGVIDQAEAERGLAYMRRLVALVAQAGDGRSFELGDGARARVYGAAHSPLSS